jgi:hypothetical protein
MSEKIIIKLTIAENSDGISSETARWLQGNRHQAIAAIQDSCKPEIIAYSKASDRDLNTARLEALAYHEYRAQVLRAQLYGHLQPPSPIASGRPEVNERNNEPIQLPPIELPTTTDYLRYSKAERPTTTHSGNGRSTLDPLDNL